MVGPRDMYTFLVTGEESGGRCSRSTVWSARRGPPPHRHLAEDELFTITEGRITFTAGESRVGFRRRSVFVPRGTRHFYRNEGTGRRG